MSAVERPDATPLVDATDQALLAEAGHRLERERATGAAVDAVDELASRAGAAVAAHFRGEPIAAVLDDVLDAVFDVMAAARRAGLVDGDT